MAQTKTPNNWPALPTHKRFGNLLTLGYIVGAISKPEESWLRNLIQANWNNRPDPNGTEYGA